MKVVKSAVSATPNKDKIYELMVDGAIGSDVVMEMFAYISDSDAGEILKALGFDDEDTYED